MNATHIVIRADGQKAALGEHIELVRVMVTRVNMAVWRRADGKTDTFPLDWAQEIAK